jgi:ubiquinone/menaquinone biosynthesis C-methylase UbiE
MTTNYDKIAFSYDFIRKMILGNTIVDAQVCLLKFIPANSRILIVGGGTGWILNEIAKIHSAGLIIDYVESSAKMITLSTKVDHGSNVINFIQLPVESYTATDKYDIILTPFLFDNFKMEKISQVFTKLDSYLKKEGGWLYADFVYNENDGRLWQRLLLKMMYIFFRITCNIETQELISMEKFFDPLYCKIFEESHYHDFIKSIAYKKSK